MTGRLEQALRLKSHGFFFLVGIGRGEPLRRQRGEGMPSPGAWGDQPAAGEPSPDGGPEAGGTSIDPPSRPSCCLALVSSLALWGPVLPPMGAC